MQVSYLAAESLSESIGVRVPKSIAYYTQPLYRIENLFASVTESVLDTNRANVGLSNHLERFNKLRLRGICNDFRKWIRPLLIWYSLNQHPPQSREVPMPIGILPGYRNDNAFGMHNNLCGTPFETEGQVSKLKNSIVDKYGQGFDIETAIRVGVEIFLKSSKSFPLFMDALALDEKLKPEFQQLIESSTYLASVEVYSSGFDPMTNFGIANSIALLNTSESYEAGLSNRVKSMFNAMIRDLTLLFIEYITDDTWKLVPSAVAIIKLEEIRNLRRLGLRVE